MNTFDPHKNAISQGRLLNVHKELQRLFEDVQIRSTYHFIITEGLRSEQRQRELVRAGASQTMKSKHLVGRAVDVAIMIGDEVRWDWPLYRKFAEEVKASAQALGIDITWGGDWKKFKDGPHFELKDSVK